ncbi:MAG: pantetheine-phosphate adenylyltransferase [Candidatus Thalassarchaeaceae archaeon]|nr:pantetheine-phosphate adenylyltransferase [Candidatus Thalassarchaeaceae archaeon]
MGQAPEQSSDGCRYAPGHTKPEKDPTGRKMMHGIGLIGGTFDRFHSGHMSLIETGLSRCEKIQVWITSDEIAQSKDSRIKKWEERKSDLESATSDFSSRISTHLLVDDFGPALESRQASAIICSNDTMPNCLEINSHREVNGLETLEIIIAQSVLSWNGATISSSQIREGLIDREGEPWIPRKISGSDARITPQVESQLKHPFGRLFEGPEEDTSIAIKEALSHISKNPDFSGLLIAVGDVTVLGLQRVGRPADLAFIDGKTKRSKWSRSGDIKQNLYDNIIQCVSPAGSLTNSLLDACNASVSSWKESGSSSLIIVSGEEDLAPLLLHPLAPIGSVVIYGQPSRGVVVRWCDEDSKDRCRNILSDFEAV